MDLGSYLREQERLDNYDTWLNRLLDHCDTYRMLGDALEHVRYPDEEEVILRAMQEIADIYEEAEQP